MNKLITLQIDENLLEQFKEVLYKNGATLSATIRLLIQDYVDRDGERVGGNCK